MYKSHAELEKYHYQALSNEMYRTEGMMDVIREELMMNQPLVNTEMVREVVIPEKVTVKHHNVQTPKSIEDRLKGIEKAIGNHLKSHSKGRKRYVY